MNYLDILFQDIQIVSEFILFSNLGNAGCVCYIACSIVTHFATLKSSLPSVLGAWLWFYLIDLAYTNRIPSITFRILFWFILLWLFENWQIWLQNETSFSRHFQLRTIYYRSICPIWIQFGMRLSYTFLVVFSISIFFEKLLNDLLPFFLSDLDKIWYALYRHQYTWIFFRSFYNFNFFSKNTRFSDLVT